MPEKMNDINKEQLLEYLNGRMDEAAQSAFEQDMEADSFLKDAAEGLKPLAGNADLTAVVEQLNQQLHRQLKHKKTPRHSHKDIREFTWMYPAVFLILLLSLIAFLMIRYFLKK
jgi:hypothetical protein